MKSIIVFIVVILFSSNLWPQEFSINGSIPGTENSKVYLMQILGEKQAIVDTAIVTDNGSFEFIVEKGFPVGMYQIIGGTKQRIEIIFNNENIRFVSSGSENGDNVQVIESVENLIWFDYLYSKGLSQYKMDVIETVLANYPEGDEYFNISKEKYKQVRDDFIKRTNELSNNNPNTIASKFIKTDKPVFAPIELNESQKQEYLIEHHFDNVDFNDTILLHSNLLNSKIVSYFTLFQGAGMKKEVFEDKLMVAVDTVLQRALVNQDVYESVVGFLIKGFEAIGFERGLEHIAEQNQLDELCVNSERKAQLENKLELIKKLSIGKIAPDFSTKDIEGNQITLSEIKSETTILLFWASWCPHCTDIIPVLKEYYNAGTPETLQVVAISVDQNEKDYRNSLKEHGLDWMNIAELKGWDGAVVEQYGVAATPTIFILDKDKKILAKPTNENSLRKAMSELE